MTPQTPRPLRVWHVSLLFAPYFAGRGIYLQKAFPYLKSEGVDSTVLTASFDHLPQFQTINDVAVHRVEIPKATRFSELLFSLKTVRYLYSRRREIDIIHLHGFWDIYCLITLFARLFGKKVVMHLTLLGGDDPLTVYRGHRFMSLRFKVLARADRFIAISSALSESCRSAGLQAARIAEIPNGVDTVYYSPASPEERDGVRRELALPVDVPIVTFVGAIIERKGVDVLLRVWSLIQSQLPTAILLLIGPDQFQGLAGDDAERFEQFCERMKAYARHERLNVRFMGRRDNVRDFLQAADAFALASRSEGFGNVINEAMSCGLPVVLTEMGGVARDHVQDGVQGFVVEGEERLAQRLASLLIDSEMRTTMGHRARQRVLERTDLQLVTRKYAALYRDVLVNGT